MSLSLTQIALIVGALTYALLGAFLVHRLALYARHRAENPQWDSKLYGFKLSTIIGLVAGIGVALLVQNTIVIDKLNQLSRKS